MTVFFENEIDAKFDFDPEEKANQVIDACLSYAECPFETEVNLLITDNDGIHQMNKEFRGIDRPTDVLSFPMLEYDQPGNFDNISEDDSDSFDPETGELLLGDIVISFEKVCAQAEEYGHSVLREYSFLITHSMLHLFGYDHIDDEEREKMEKIQDQILTSIGIVR